MVAVVAINRADMEVEVAIPVSSLVATVVHPVATVVVEDLVAMQHRPAWAAVAMGNNRRLYPASLPKPNVFL